MHAQTPQPAATLAFEVASVKPAPPGATLIAPDFMRDKSARILGVQRMAAPVNMFVGYAYGMQKSENLAAFRKQPEWTRNKFYTVTFRASGEPTRDQLREMMRTLLAERFSLEIHNFTRDGTVNRLVLNKPGVRGPNLKPHPAGSTCSLQDSSLVGHAPDSVAPPLTHCGLSWYYLPGMVVHEDMTDITIAALGLSLASRGDSGFGTNPVVDATGLPGTYDLTLEFLPGSITQLSDPEAEEGDAPSLARALKEQLGIRVESGQGPVRMFVIDHLSEPTPD